MAAAPDDRLSVLPDDLLRRILSFTPPKTGASTAVLSRRWRPVWLRSGTLSLDSEPYAATIRATKYLEPYAYGGYIQRTSYTDSLFLPDAVKVLDALRRATADLKSLTLSLDKSAYSGAKPYRFMDEKEKQKEEAHDRVGGVVLAHPAAAQLEELRVRCRPDDYRYRPWLAPLPCAATLRVLDLTRCDIHPPPTATATVPLSAGIFFPCLTDLQLRGCVISEGYLQVVVDAAPALTNLVLVNVSHKPAVEPDSIGWIFCRPGFRARLRLWCPTVTAFVLEASAHKEELEPWANPGIELDMPSLRSFRYKGFPVKLSLMSSTPALERVDLDVSRESRHEYRVQQYYEPVSRILASFTGTRALKLRLRCIEDIIVGVVLPTFPSLELLEVEGHYKYMNRHTGAAMARLLNSCPAMSELRLRLNMERDYEYECKIKNMGGGPFAQSMERFNRLGPMSSVHRDIVQLGGVSELPGSLTNNNCAFSCLQKSLRKVTLKFKAMEVNCFQVQLAKFLVENAMVLRRCKSMMGTSSHQTTLTSNLQDGDLIHSGEEISRTQQVAFGYISKAFVFYSGALRGPD
ncbi:hypothetical protein VPH35_026969 [Triticum aestivum]|uniref:F-box domain-containing protein n=1 Tax=Triticum turgidum subsp. durum TaxID=4567 RepID=A0A9R1PF46_TRITD|nr:unnamed protein product [Triticum turgidum subsp. durum]